MDLNFDGMTYDELMEFWKKANSVRPIAFARELFPDRPRGYVATTRDLGNYASNKATAVGLRLQGRIQNALQYEGICDRIYLGLPSYATW
jgi:hypothetical protein